MGVEMAEQRAGGALSQAAHGQKFDWYTQDDPRIAEMRRALEMDRVNSENGLGNLNNQTYSYPVENWGEGTRPLAPGERYAKRGDAQGLGPLYNNAILDAQGNVMPGTEWSSQTDDRDFFKQGLMMMAAPFAGPLAGAYGGGATGAAGAGATIGGVAGHASTDSFQGGLRGAATGAVMGGAGYAAGQAFGGAGSAAGYPGEGVPSGVPQWDAAPTSWPGGVDPGLTTQLGGAPQFDAMQFDPNGDYNVMNAGADVPPAPYGSGDPYNPDPAGFGSGPVSDAPDPMADYLRTGATDMSTPTGQGGYAGAIDAASGGTEMLGTYEHALYGPPGGPGSTPPGGGDQVEITTTRLPAQPPAGPGLGTAAAGAGALSTVANAGDAPISGDGGGDPYNDPSGPNYKPVEVDPSFQSPDYLDLLTRGASSLFNNSSLMNGLMSLIGHGVNQASIERAAQEQRNWLDKQASDKRRRQMPGALARARISVIPGSASRMTTPTTPDRARAG